MARRLVLITGASAGIGLSFARTYAAHGWDVVVTARRQDRLDKLVEEIRLRFGVEAHAIAADLADPTAAEALQQGILALGRSVDGLVNNAGYGQPGGFLGSTIEQHRALPGFAERRDIAEIARTLTGCAMRGILKGAQP